MVEEDSVKNGVQEYTCLSGWIDWSHAVPDRMDLTNLWAQFPHSVRKGQEPLRLCPLPGKKGYQIGYDASLSLNWKVKAGMKVLGLPTVFRYEVKDFGFDEEKYKRTALHIYQKGCEYVERVQLLMESMHHSSFSYEDLASNLLAFYMHVEGWNREAAMRRCGGWLDLSLAKEISLAVHEAMEKDPRLNQETLKASGWDKAYLFNDLCGAAQPYKKRGWTLLPPELRKIEPLQCRPSGGSVHKTARAGEEIDQGRSPSARRLSKQTITTGPGGGRGRRPGPVKV